MVTTSSATATTSAPLSNAASVVGRHIRFLETTESSQSAVIISYNPDNNTHTVEFQNGTEKVVVLNKCQFKFLVSKCEAADKRGHKARMLLAAQRDTVGRPIKILSDKRNMFVHGTITAFDEETGKHAITLKNKNKTVYQLNLQSTKIRWKYCDLIGGADRHPGGHSIVSSRYAGVRRTADSSWIAYKGCIGRMEGYIGTFTSEKDAALAYDYYARKQQLKVINFPNEQLTEDEIEKRKSNGRTPSRGHGKSKYRGVHWQKNRKRWMARYTLAQKREKNINLGAFENAEYAAMAFDFEARKRGRPDCDLNFPDKRPTEEQIEQWKTNTTHYTMIGSGRKKSSQYRGVSWSKHNSAWRVQCGISKVLEGMKEKKKMVRLGDFYHEKEAALAFDRACRKFGVAEKELNFPRNHHLLKEVRLFDDECYFCFLKSPTDPVATPCNHVFCRTCIVSWLETFSSGSCPCCKMPNLKKDALRSVTLVPWPKKPDHCTTRKRKRNDEQPASAATAATTTDNNSSNSEMSDDDDDTQTGSPDTSHGRNNVHKTANKRTKSGSQKNETHEGSSDCEHDQAGTPDSKQRRGNEDKTGYKTYQAPKKRQAARGSSKLAASLPKSPPGPGKRKRQLKYPIGTRFIKEFKGHDKFKGRVVNFKDGHYKVYYPQDGDEESLSEIRVGRT